MIRKHEILKAFLKNSWMDNVTVTKPHGSISARGGRQAMIMVSLVNNFRDFYHSRRLSTLFTIDSKPYPEACE
jgi:hypothetical protein